ncbi:probable cationic amino acid transporter [Anastrepha ludens]|uniref:probable cationic amino acid transporter n=1 Tax=Anastrepha ludens TaxID=28586 RepID=UPI0023AE8246|nr:probable cationic amino acid transporter [Anastrepha ludens]
MQTKPTIKYTSKLANTIYNGPMGTVSHNVLFDGSGARMVVGSAILVYLLVYNEACAPAIVLANFLACIYGLIAAFCKSSLRSLQMPYIRATNKFDFTCLFLATWMDVLAVLCACAALARTMSTCLDAMTGGMAHILILGRNSSANEPWPDVVGVAVVLLITGMFMLGLENSKVFCMIMLTGMVILGVLVSAVTLWKADSQEWKRYLFRPNGINSFLTAAGLLTFAYPKDYPSKNSFLDRMTGIIYILRTFCSIMLKALGFSLLMNYKPAAEYNAIPIFTFVNDLNFHNFVPAIACLLMLTCSAAYLELFQELYGYIVRFATAEWKVFSKQISYESPDSGNPVLAIFISGSLCAMLAFACPMQHLSYIMASSHLFAGFLRSFYLLYLPFRPKYIQRSNFNSSLSYSRLSTAPVPEKSSSSNSKSKRSLLNASLAKKSAIKKPKTKKKPKKELEKEWLLLGEPTSPCPVREPKDVESAILSDREPPPSDFEFPEKFEKSDSDTSTDIDAIVDEYRQKIKVTTAGPMERTGRLPTLLTWRFAMLSIFMIVSGSILCSIAFVLHHTNTVFIYFCGAIIVSSMMSVFPSYHTTVISVSPVLCSASVMMASMLFVACSYYSWPAILFWLIAGLILVMRCDNWCCGCFEYSGGNIQEQLIPSVSAKTATKATTIRIPRPPKTFVTIPTRVSLSSR